MRTWTTRPAPDGKPGREQHSDGPAGYLIIRRLDQATVGIWDGSRDLLTHAGTITEAKIRADRMDDHATGRQ